MSLSELIDLVAEQYDREKEVGGFWVMQMGEYTYVCSVEHDVSDFVEHGSVEDAVLYFDRFDGVFDEEAGQ